MPQLLGGLPRRLRVAYIRTNERFRLVTVPWIISILLTTCYLLVLFFSITSQLFPASLSFRHSIIKQNGTYSFNFQTFYYVSVKVDDEFRKNNNAYWYFTLYQESTNKYVLVKPFEISSPDLGEYKESFLFPDESSPIDCASSGQYNVRLMSGSGSDPIVSGSDVVCYNEIDPAISMLDNDIIVDVYPNASLFLYRQSGFAAFYVGVVVTIACYSFMTWMRKWSRYHILFYVFSFTGYLLCVVSDVVSQSITTTKLVVIFFLYFLSLLPLVHWYYLMRIAHIAVTQSGLYSGFSLFDIISMQPKVTPMPVLRTSSFKSETCPYYCPICMVFHEQIFKAACCYQYVCRPCITSFIGREFSYKSVATNVDCPYCVHPGVAFMLVQPGEKARNYEDSPSVTARFVSVRKGSMGGSPLPSPARIGDSFDKMKAKMITFEQAGYKTPLPPLAPLSLDTSSSNLLAPPDAENSSVPASTAVSPYSSAVFPPNNQLPPLQRNLTNSSLRYSSNAITNTNVTNNDNGSVNINHTIIISAENSRRNSISEAGPRRNSLIGAQLLQQALQNSVIQNLLQRRTGNSTQPTQDTDPDASRSRSRAGSVSGDLTFNPRSRAGSVADLAVQGRSRSGSVAAAPETRPRPVNGRAELYESAPPSLTNSANFTGRLPPIITPQGSSTNLLDDGTRSERTSSGTLPNLLQSMILVDRDKRLNNSNSSSNSSNITLHSSGAWNAGDANNSTTNNNGQNNGDSGNSISNSTSNNSISNSTSNNSISNSTSNNSLNSNADNG